MPRAYWPSGHMTAIVSVALALLLGVPKPFRPVAAMAAVVAAAVMGGLLSGSTFRAMIAAVFVCGIWASLAVAGLAASADRVPEKEPAAGDQPAEAAQASSWSAWASVRPTAGSVVTSRVGPGRRVAQA